MTVTIVRNVTDFFGTRVTTNVVIVAEVPVESERRGRACGISVTVDSRITRKNGTGGITRTV